MSDVVKELQRTAAGLSNEDEDAVLKAIEVIWALRAENRKLQQENAKLISPSFGDRHDL